MRDIYEYTDGGGDRITFKYQGKGLLVLVAAESGEHLAVIIPRHEAVALTGILHQTFSLAPVMGAEGGASEHGGTVPIQGEPGPAQRTPARASIDALMADIGDVLEMVKDIGPTLVSVDMRRGDVAELRSALPVHEADGQWRGVEIREAADVPIGAARANYADGSWCWIEILPGAFEALGIDGTLVRPAKWTPSPDTHAPAPRPIGQATMAGYPEPWEESDR